MDRAVRNVDGDGVAVFDQPDHPTGRRLRRTVADRQPRRTAREAAIGQQRAFLAQPHRLQVAGRIQHLLHARPALRPLVTDDHHLARHHLAGQNAAHRLFLALVHPCPAGELQDAFVHPGRLHDAAVLGQVALQHRQTAVLTVGMRLCPDAAMLAVAVQRLPARILRKRLRRADAGRPGAEELLDVAILRLHDVVLRQLLLHRRPQNGARLVVQQPGPVQLAQNGHHAAGAVHILHVVLLGVRRHLRQAGHRAREPVDVGHGEIHLGFLRCRQQVQHRVGRTAHGDVQAHRVLEGIARGQRTRQHRGIVLLIIATAQLDDLVASPQEQLPAVGVRGQTRTIARQAQPQRLGQAVHRVGREHPRTRATGRTGRLLDHVAVGIAHRGVRTLVDGVHQVELDHPVGQLRLAGLHRPARHEHRRNVQPQCGHQHARGDLVAVGDAHHGVCTVRIDHVLHRIGDQVARGQRIQHPAMAHRNAVVHGNGVELLGHRPGLLDLFGHQPAHVAQMHMPRHELRERVDHGNDRLAEIGFLHAGGAPERAGTGHVAALGTGGRA